MSSPKDLDVRKLLDHFGIEYEERGDGELRVLCAFHADENPSCQINVEKKAFFCYTCEAKGDVINYIAGRMNTTRPTIIKELELEGWVGRFISQKMVEKWHQALLKTQPYLEALKKKGISKETIDRYSLGVNRQRITIPIYDDAKNIVNVRQYSPNPKDARHKVINYKGFGGRRLYPYEALADQEIWITEGELKALLLRERGFNAMCATGGAGTWAMEWNDLFAKKDVVLCYDIDDAGIKGANRVARCLYPTAKSVTLVVLPIDRKEFPKGDVTDWLVDLNHTAEDLRELQGNSQQWSPALFRRENEEEEDEEVTPVHLSQSSLAKWHGKRVETEALVSAKDTAPYIIPAEIEVVCQRDSGNICLVCPVAGFEPGETLKIGPTNPVVLELVGISTDQQERAMKKAAGVPRSCSQCIFKAKKSMNIEELRLIPQLKIATQETDHVVRRAFYVGHGIETNTAYMLRSKVIPEPQSQYATLLTYEAEASVDSLSTFKLTRELKTKLKLFQPKEWTLTGLRVKLDQIYEDLEANVTHIYMRRDLHVFYDLVYHSVLYIRFQGQPIKGWVEGLVVGDSGQGKSEAIKHLMNHYGLGEKIDAKGASVAGLLGGLQETAKRWFVSWGVITLNDRRLVVLEEIKGMHQEVIAKLTDMRSSGIAEVSKVEKAKTNARTRLVWISNPRSDDQVMSYNFGITAVRELIGSLEDVRRFDMAIMLASGEVDRKVLNLRTGDRPTAEHTYTHELCQSLVLWTWSRKLEDVQLTEEAEELLLKESSRMGKEYSATIPLVEAADQRLKLLRLSAACAARTFSTEDGQTLLVRKCHVEYVVEFLDRIYDSPAMGYRDYSKNLAGEKQLRDADQVEAILNELPHQKDAIQSMLEAPGMTATDMMDWAEMDKDTAREFIGGLVRKNALKRGRRYYVKTPAFIAMLRRISNNGELSNEAPAEVEF